LCQISENNDTTPKIGMSADGFLSVSASHIQLCMESNGYEIIPNAKFAACNFDAHTPVDKVASWTYGQAVSPQCYAPMNIVSRQLFKLERLFGQVN
jgi:hypothetical protein